MVPFTDDGLTGNGVGRLLLLRHPKTGKSTRPIIME